MTRAHRGMRGTTLVEVLVAVAVIGALASIGIPQYASYTEKGREAQCIANRHNVESASRACTLDTGKSCLTTSELVKSGYMSGMPSCPSGGEYVWLKDDPSDREAPKMGCSKHYWDSEQERHADGSGGGGSGGGGEGDGGSSGGGGSGGGGGGVECYDRLLVRIREVGAYSIQKGLNGGVLDCTAHEDGGELACNGVATDSFD